MLLRLPGGRPPRGGTAAWLGGAALMLLAVPAAAQTSGGAGAATGASSADTGASASQPSDAGSDVPGVPPVAGAVLPATGFDPNQSDLRGNLLSAFGQNAAPQAGSAQAGPAWQYTPALTVTEDLTDNPDQFGGLNYGVGRRRYDAITLITPSLLVLGNTERFRVDLNYAPTGVIYATDSDYSQLRQQFYGSVQTIAVPDLLFIDTRGSVSENPVFGGLSGLNTAVLPPSQRETQSELSVSPYLNHAFGGTGTLQAGVGYIYSATDAPSFLDGNTQALPLALPFNYGSQWLATRRVFASFTTGQDFGRFQDAIDTDNSFYDGSGASRDAHRILVTDDASYAINRFVSGLGEIGYENLSYPNSGYSFVGGVWSAGVRLTPNAQSSISLEYRRIDGITAPYVFGYWQITPRIRIFGDYSTGITTFQQDQQDQLLAGSANQTGVAASALVAAPLLNNASLFGANQALTNTQRANINVSYIADRDVLTATFNQQRSSLVGNRLGLPTSLLARFGVTDAELAQLGLLTTQTNATTSAVLTWRHDISPTWSADAQIGYSRSSVAQSTSDGYASVLFSIGVNKTFSDTLSGRLAYTGNYGVSNGGLYADSLNSNTITITLSKRFR